MPEIENMAAGIPGPVQNPLDAFLNFRMGEKEGAGVHVPLQGNSTFHLLHGICHVNSPVKAQDIRTGLP
jgi:hypothetical protein